MRFGFLIRRSWVTSDDPPFPFLLFLFLVDFLFFGGFASPVSYFFGFGGFPVSSLSLFLLVYFPFSLGFLFFMLFFEKEYHYV